MSERVLGVEGGGTKTAWVLFDHTDGRLNILEQGRLPPANLRLTPPERLRAFFAELPQRIDRAGIFLAGCVMHLPLISSTSLRRRAESSFLIY